MVKASRKERVNLKKGKPATEASLKDMEPLKWIGKTRVCVWGGDVIKREGCREVQYCICRKKEKKLELG